MSDLAPIAVVIPALNEEPSIGKVLDAISREIAGHPVLVVVADNGSTDRTAAVAREHGAEVVDEPERGYGAACLRALEVVGALDPPAEVVAFVDADYSDHPDELPGLVEPILRDEADLVIGTRVRRATRGALTPQQRFGNALACLLIRGIYGVRFSDLGPFRAVRGASLTQLAMDDRNFGWTVQMQVRAAKQKLRCREVDVSYRPRIGKSKISGTVRGVIMAGTIILYTIFAELRRR